ncbi:MAG TPA: hypothetical protein VK066_05675 [Chloroflexota bacterium]|nr:hypothetical protein [Chloroflexota bacterium]
MNYDASELRERDYVELLPGTALPPGYRIPAGAQGRIVMLDDAAPGWATVQFGRYGRPAYLPLRQLRRVPATIKAAAEAGERSGR